MDLLTNLLAEFIWFVIGILATIYGLRTKRVRNFAKKLGLKVHFDKPQLDFDILTNQKSGKADLVVKNAGNRPAYNVYAFVFEGYEVTTGFNIRSLGEQRVRSGVLAVGEKITFTDKELAFIGCNVTVKQEIWIDYSDEDNDHYRTIVIPTNPRGDDMKVLPPMQIKNRIPLAPSLNYESKDHWETYRNGQSFVLNLSY